MRLAFSIGDVNGISTQLLFLAHEELSSFCTPFYFVHENLLQSAASLLEKDLSKLKNLNLVEFKSQHESLDFASPKSTFTKKNKATLPNISLYQVMVDEEFDTNFALRPGCHDRKSGEYSFAAFKAAAFAVGAGDFDALITLPINKKCWELARVPFLGHTGALSLWFKSKAIMMLGCDQLYTALYTEHIPLARVPASLSLIELSNFLYTFARVSGFTNIGVLGLNPHAGDDGAIGKEEVLIKEALALANYACFKKTPPKALLPYKTKRRKKSKNLKISKKPLANLKAFKASKFTKVLNLKKQEKIEEFSVVYSKRLPKSLKETIKATNLHNLVFYDEPLVPDCAFSKFSLLKFKVLVGLYHDQVLAPLKALYFKESINVSLNLPITRTSVDHGTAFDKAYKGKSLSTLSLINAAKAAITFKEKM